MKHATLDYDRGRSGRSSRGVRIDVPRGIVCAVCIAIAVTTIVLLSGSSFPVVLYRLLTDGGLCVVWVSAAVGWGAIVQRAFGYRIGVNLFDFANASALGLGLLSLIALLLGWAGGLNRMTGWLLIAIGVVYLAIALRTQLANIRSAREWFAHPARGSWLWPVAMPALGIALVAAFVPPGVLWGDEPHGYDVVEYHLQAPREWYEAGRVTPLTHNVYSFMPMNVEMHYLLAMHLRGGPWAGMYLAQLMHLAFVALSVIAIVAMTESVVSAVAVAVTPWLLLLAPIAYNEGGLLLFGALAIGWAWRALRDPDESDWRCWALAGAFAGLACGTKLTAAPMLLTGIPIAVAVAQRFRVHVRSLATFVVTGVLVFSPWLIRNVAYARNPVFPEAMSVLGRAHFTEDQQERWRRAHSPVEEQRPLVARIKAARDQIAFDWRFGYTLLLAAVFAIPLARTREAYFIAALLAIFLIIWLAFTHLQSRFFVLAIPASAFAIASGLRAAPKLAFPAAINFALAAVLGLLHLHLRYLSLEEDPPGRLAQVIDSRALGLESLGALQPVETENVPLDQTLVLVGDAQAFFYDRPMRTLRYRTVFDVNQREGQSIIDAWAGEDVAAGSVLLIDANELNRMSVTYWKIGAVPPDVLSRRSRFLQQK